MVCEHKLTLHPYKDFMQFVQKFRSYRVYRLNDLHVRKPKTTTSLAEA